MFSNVHSFSYSGWLFKNRLSWLEDVYILLPLDKEHELQVAIMY
jgi:hypothetical protein